MKLQAAKMDAQLLANRLKGGWLIVRTGPKVYKIVAEGEATPEDLEAKRLTISPNYEIHQSVKDRVRNYKARRKRSITNETMRKKSI